MQFAEFNEQGDVVNEIGEAIDDLANATVISGEGYRAFYSSYTAYMAQHSNTDARGAYVLDRDSYNASLFFTVDGQRVTNVPRLRSATKSVLVRNPVALLTPGTSPILFESGVDLNQIQNLEPTFNSILLTSAGQIHTKSRFNIGYRASFVKPKGAGEVGECAPSYDASQDNKYFNYREDDPCGPVAGAMIETQVFPGVDGGTISGPDGKYFLTYMSLPCPGFDFEFTHHIFHKIFYRNFNPRSPAGISWYYGYSPVYDYCSGSFENLRFSTSLSGQMAYVNAVGIASTLSVPNKVLNPKIDIIVLTGKGKVANSLNPVDAIPLGTTQYGTDLPSFAPVAPEALDLDGNGVTDPTAIRDYDGDGKMEVGVYLNGHQPGDTDATGTPIPPDLIRQTDTVPDTKDQGLLTHISEADLKDTDIYIYRLSNGQQILARKGLVPTEYARGQGSGLLDDGNSSFYYRAMVPGGSISSAYTLGSFDAFQTRAGINPAFHQRKADHLRVGEFVKVIAVNRKTGYIGTVTTQVGNAATNSDGTQGIGQSFVDFPINDIVMRPPNLKIKAERKYNVEAGLTRGEERNYLIGFEGSALNSDRVVAISTEWMDHDGTPLPDDLPGYTGRVAKVVSNTGADRLQAVGSDGLAEFAIKPGTHLQLIQLPENGALGNQHFYIHVNGKPPEDSPDFSSDATGAGPGLLQYRPNYYVPFQVPIFDEVETRRRRNAQQSRQGRGLPGGWEGSKWRKHRQVLRRYPRNSRRAQDDRTVKWWVIDGKPLLDLGKKAIYSSYTLIGSFIWTE